MGNGQSRVVNNGAPFTALDSTFTCTNTGEVLKTSYTFTRSTLSAVLLVSLQNGQLTGSWSVYHLLD